MAALAVVRAVDDPARSDLRWLVLGWAACAVGMLAKGLIGLVLPALIVGPWLLAQRRWRQTLSLLHPLGLAVFALIAVPWMWAMQLRYPGFFDYFIVEQHFRRFTGMAFNNVQPFWFFAAALPLLMLPWTLWLVPALRQRGVRAALHAWWVLEVVAFFSLPASKLVGYVMPALAPAAALLSLGLVSRPRLWPRLAAAAGTLCVAAVLVLAWQAPGSHRDVALALRPAWQPGDRLVFADGNFFDLRFYARIDTPAIVLSDWADPELPRHDNWRKELFDTARFDAAAGRATLWGWDRLGQLACIDGRTWIVATPEQLPRLAALAGLQTVLQGRHALLLRADRRACGSGP